MDPTRLYTFKGDVHTPIPQSPTCVGGIGICTSGGLPARQPYCTSLPTDVCNSPNEIVQMTGCGTRPTTEDAALNGRIRQILALDQQAFGLELIVLEPIHRIHERSRDPRA